MSVRIQLSVSGVTWPRLAARYLIMIHVSSVRTTAAYGGDEVVR